MAYASLSDLKAYLGITNTNDDALLTDLLNRATSTIEAYTGRVFEAATATRYYREEEIRGQVLHVGQDLVSVTTLKDGTGATIANTEYWLSPRNLGPPYYAIELKVDSSAAWVFDTDGWVEVIGTWGYSASPPDDVVQACIRLAAYFYRQKDAQVFETTAFPEAGVIQVPKGIPADVRQLLNRYRRLM